MIVTLTLSRLGQNNYYQLRNMTSLLTEYATNETFYA